MKIKNKPFFISNNAAYTFFNCVRCIHFRSISQQFSPQQKMKLHINLPGPILSNHFNNTTVPCNICSELSSTLYLHIYTYTPGS